MLQCTQKDMKTNKLLVKLIFPSRWLPIHSSRTKTCDQLLGKGLILIKRRVGCGFFNMGLKPMHNIEQKQK